MTPTGRTIVRGTAVAGTLDLLSAFVFNGMAGATPLQVLAGVASGPFPNLGGGIGPALAGMLVHFTIMAAMVSAFVLAAKRMPALLDRPVLAGLLYGMLLYLVMYRLVLPMRFPETQPRNDWWTIANALFSHCICVGLPIALIARAGIGRPRFR